MAPRSITTSQVPVACDVCGRTLLRGENADVFLAGGSRRTVCELCVTRAAHEGWIREGIDDSLGVRPRADRRSLLGRLRQRRDGLREPAPRSRRGEPTLDTHSPEAEASPYDSSLDAVPVAPVDAPPEPAPAGRAPSVAAVTGEPAREPRHIRAVPTNADLKTARALDVFNASDAPRTVAGVARSLGAPFVVVRPREAAGSRVSIVVGWELCWYRYEVDLADEASGVRLDAQGDEIFQLDPADQVPNAAADEYGELVLVS